MTKTFVIARSVMQCVGHGSSQQYSSLAAWLVFIILEEVEDEKNI